MKPLLTIFLLFSAVLVKAQRELKYILSLDGFPIQQKVQLPFSEVVIIDARFDQNTVGSVVSNLSFKAITQQKMQASFPEKFTDYLPKIIHNLAVFDAKSPDTLAILIKQFRIADHISSTGTDPKGPETVLNISCSFYQFNKSHLTKIFSIDELSAEPWKADNPNKDDISKFRGESIITLLYRVLENRNWTPSATSFSLADVTDGINKRFSLPALTDTFLVAGIYKTFEEFKKNAPSILEFKIGRRYDGAIKEVVDKNGTVISPKEFWGLCDGKDKYICFQSGLHKLIPAEKSFRFIFQRRLAEADFPEQSQTYFNMPRGNTGSVVMPMHNSYSGDFRPEFLYLNLDNGEVHVEEIIGTMPLRKLRTKSD